MTPSCEESRARQAHWAQRPLWLLIWRGRGSGGMPGMHETLFSAVQHPSLRTLCYYLAWLQLQLLSRVDLHHHSNTEINVSWLLQPFNCLSYRDKAVKDSVAVFQCCQGKQTTAECRGKEQQSDSDCIPPLKCLHSAALQGVYSGVYGCESRQAPQQASRESSTTPGQGDPPSFTALRLREKRELFGLVPTTTGCRKSKSSRSEVMISAHRVSSKTWPDEITTAIITFPKICNSKTFFTLRTLH